jgi:hypothetical protein
MKTKRVKDVDLAKDQAAAQLESVIEMVKRLEDAREDGPDEEIENAEINIQEGVLSVEVRGPWRDIGACDCKPEEARILLCTGASLWPTVIIRLSCRVQ